MIQPLDRRALSAALTDVVRRHEILRTSFVSRPDGAPVQQVVEDVHVPVVWAGARWRNAIELSTIEPFDLSHPPLFRVVVATLRGGDECLFLVMHHIVTDRWSVDLLARDLFEFYAARVANRAPGLPDLTLQYGDYALRQRRFLDSALIQPQVDYWKQALAGSTRLVLPVDRLRSAAPGTVGEEVVVELSAEFTAAMTAMAWRARGSPAIIVTAALSAVLRALTGQSDIVIGAIISDRPRPELQDLIGYLINTVVLRIDFSANALTFRELVRRTRDAWMAAHANQDVPFERIAAALTAQSMTSRDQIFNVVVNHGGDWPGADGHPGIPQTWDPETPDISTFELSICTLMMNTLMVGGRLRCAFVYDPSLFDRSTVATVSSRYVELLEQGVAAPDDPLSFS